MNAKEIAVRCRGLSKEFGDGDARIQVLRGVDLTVHLGEMTFLVGPSGSGKTTLLSVIAGLLNKSSGAFEVLGQGLDQTTPGSDTAALQAAAATLFTGGRMPLGTTLAQSIGLDDIAVRGSSSLAAGGSGTTGASGQVIAVGKRLSDRLYIVYEQGLSVAQNALRIEYALTRNITIRAEAGLVSGVGIYYRKSFN